MVNIIFRQLPVKIGMSGKEVSRIVAHKMKVTNPEDFSLYTLKNGKGLKR